MENRIRIGISACLLGQPVRFDGSHKHDRYITGTLEEYFDFVPVCPEVEAGFPVPYSALVGTIALLPTLPWAVAPDAWTWSRAALFVMLGLFAGVGLLLLTRAYLRAPASLLAPFTYLQIVWATAFGFAFFGQFPDGWSFAGMAVIVASGLALAWQERQRARAAVRIP